MVIPGLLVEYFINGALAIIWLYPLYTKLITTSTFVSYLNADKPMLAIVLAASIYFIGMTIDIIAWASTRRIKKRIVRKKVIDKHFKGERVDTNSISREVMLAVYAPDVAKESAMRSSRDRIARGAIINSIIATFVFAILTGHPWLSIAAGVIFTIICFRMWIGFEKISFEYELNAEKILKKKYPELKNQDVKNQ